MIKFKIFYLDDIAYIIFVYAIVYIIAQFV